MTLQSSGAISLANLATEFGDGVPHSMSEFYKAGSLVPTTVPDVVTASNLSGTNSTNLRTAQFGGYNPAINTTTPGTAIYIHQLWADNGSTGTVNRTFNINKGGTFNFFFGWYSYALTAPLTINVNGSQVFYGTQIAYNTTVSTYGSFTAPAGAAINVVTSFPSSGWAGHYTWIGGSSYNNNTIDLSVNTSVPTSGVISLSNFYGARDS